MKYTTAKTFHPTEFSGPERTIVVKANGGKVEVFAPIDLEADQWIKAGEYTTDDIDPVFQGNASIKIVPTGGAEYNLY